MAERLGNVLYWLGCGLALVMIGFALWAAQHETSGAKMLVFLFFGGIGVAIWLAGRAIKYVLSGI